MRVSLCLLTVWLFLACADRARGNCTNSFLVKTDGKGEIYPNPQSIMKVCRNARCTSFLFITIQICSFSLSCDNSKISLIYVSPASK